MTELRERSSGPRDWRPNWTSFRLTAGDHRLEEERGAAGRVHVSFEVQIDGDAQVGNFDVHHMLYMAEELMRDLLPTHQVSALRTQQSYTRPSDG